MAPLSPRPLGEWGIPEGDLMVVAGPCSAESPEQVMETARGLAGQKVHVLRAGIWKPRTRPGSFEGAGRAGLTWVKDAGRAVGLPVAVEVATPVHVGYALNAGIDILWIGARTTANPFLVAELAAALRGSTVPVLVKNPINPDVQLWLGALERLADGGVKRLGAVHRGFSTQSPGPYRNEPIWRIPLELRRLAPGIPLLCDPSHICGSIGPLAAICQSALDLLFDGFMIEVHCCPERAKSDAAQQLTPAAFAEMMAGLVRRNRSSGSDEYRARIGALRHDLDEIDREIIGRLAARMGVARNIALVQREANVAMFNPDRFAATLETLAREGAARGLNRRFMEDLYRLIHEEALRHKTDTVEIKPFRRTP